MCRFLLTLMLLAITTSDAFRLRDLKNTVQHIPLKRVNPNGGFRFLEGPDFHFDKELRELNEFRVRRSAEGSLRVHNHTKITEEFELTGDIHTVAFLHWSGKKSPVSSNGFTIEIKSSLCLLTCFLLSHIWLFISLPNFCLFLNCALRLLNINVANDLESENQTE